MAAVPWTQTPDFRAATNTTLVPGGPTAYLVPRRTGNSPQDVTDFHPGQANWSRDNLPNVLYMLESPPARNAFKGTRKPLPKRDQANQIVYERWPEAGQKIRPLRDFKVLPDRIGTKESWWVIEAWRRLDPRIEWPDILMRMERVARTKEEDKKISNSMNMFATRQRSIFGLVSWHPRGIGKQRLDRHNEVLAKLTDAQRANNTTRGFMPGLINPALGEAGGRIPSPYDFEEGQRKRGPPKGKAKVEKDKEEEDVKGEESDEEENEESSSAPSSIPRGPPRGLFAPPRSNFSRDPSQRTFHPSPANLYQGPPPGFSYPAPTLESNGRKRGRDQTLEEFNAETGGRKKIRTTAPSAEFGLIPTPMAGPMPHYDPHLAEDFACYGIDITKRKADDLEAEDEPRKRPRRGGMVDVVDVEACTPAPRARPTRIPSSRRPVQDINFLGHIDPALLDPALFAPPFNPFTTELAATETRHQRQMEGRNVVRAPTQAHLPGARAAVGTGTRMEGRSVLRAPLGEHLPGARTLNNSAPRIWDNLPQAWAQAGTESQPQRHTGASIMDGHEAHLPGARAPGTTTTRIGRHSEVRAAARGPAAPPTLGRAQNTTGTRLEAGSEASAPSRGERLPRGRAPATTDTASQRPGEASNEAGQAPWEHLPGARTQITEADRALAEILRAGEESEEQKAENDEFFRWINEVYPGPVPHETPPQFYQPPNLSGPQPHQPPRAINQQPNLSGSMATYAGNAQWETTQTPGVEIFSDRRYYGDMPVGDETWWRAVGRAVGWDM